MWYKIEGLIGGSSFMCSFGSCGGCQCNGTKELIKNSISVILMCDLQYINTAVE